MQEIEKCYMIVNCVIQNKLNSITPAITCLISSHHMPYQQNKNADVTC